MYKTAFGASTREDVFGSFNLGQETLTMSLPLSQFVEITDVANASGVVPEEIAQRELDRAHATGLAVYILKGVLHAARNEVKRRGEDTAVYDKLLERMGDRRHYSLQPIVVSIPAKLEDLDPKPIKDANDTVVAYRITLPLGTVLWVVDGQHRRYAMTLLLDFLKFVINNRAYQKKGSLYPVDKEETELQAGDLAAWRLVHQMAGACTVAVEAHLNLTVDEQRQLFHDLNNLGKKVAAGTSFDFDSSNPVNNFIKQVLIEEGVLGAEVDEKDVTDWAKHEGSIARKDLVAICSILFLNKTNARTATPLHVLHMEEPARRFWEQVSNIPGFGELQAKLNTVAAQPVVLKALAKLTYDFARGRAANPEHLERLLDGIGEIDFSHDNPMWDYYDLTPEERRRKLPGLDRYMPSDEGNRDIGGRDESGRMRFGAKHNDIYPIIGDMIRWRLDLPSRHVDDKGEAAAA
ncbi:MAG: hypothetical protein FJX25_03975 [Alphaproteobacteria bacterium]|nr:hypothetical protein [Alphaproteobacteria bacterium]